MKSFKNAGFLLTATLAFAAPSSSFLTVTLTMQPAYAADMEADIGIDVAAIRNKIEKLERKKKELKEILAELDRFIQRHLDRKGSDSDSIRSQSKQRDRIANEIYAIQEQLDQLYESIGVVPQ